MNRQLKKIWNTVSGVIVALVVVFALLLVGARVVGLQVFTVLSGSMEPTYHTGSLIYVKKVDNRTIEPGTVITFMLDEDTIATHRVVGVVPDEEDPSVIRYRTKGDANEAEDGGLVHYKNVIGTPVFTIPYLGFVADYIQKPPGMYIAIAAAAVLLLIVFIPDVFADDETSENEGKNSKNKKKKKSAGAAKTSETSHDIYKGRKSVSPVKKTGDYRNTVQAPSTDVPSVGGVSGTGRSSNAKKAAGTTVTEDRMTALAEALKKKTGGLLTDAEIAVICKRMAERPLNEEETAAINRLIRKRRAAREEARREKTEG